MATVRAVGEAAGANSSWTAWSVGEGREMCGTGLVQL